jgi:hypothetical protein
LRGHLQTLVQRTPELAHIFYVLKHLRVPSPSNDSFDTVVSIRKTALARLQLGPVQLLAQLKQIQARAQLKTHTELAAVWGEVQRLTSRDRDKEEEQAKKLSKLEEADAAALTTALADKDPTIQLAAIQVVHRRRLHRERELITCLESAQPLIRTAARAALVRLARGADFGPEPDADRLEFRSALRRWKTWLARQEGPAAAEPPPPDPTDAEASRWAVELAQATPDRETPLLQRLRSAAEPQGTLALAAAIRELKGVRQTRAREVLAQRLAAQGEATLKKRLTDEDAEVRRAAVTAAGTEKAKALIPEALKLLEDPDAGVAQAARSALKRLTDRDFGPAPDASPQDRSVAIGEWYRWWVAQRKGS